MYKMMIVDDEKMMCNMLMQVIDWGELGIEIVDTCRNGLEAYDRIMLHKPDIVLTDIKMPKLSGIELIKKVTEENLNVKFILLSAYAEFEYAREAMRYNVKHYLLKPCNEEQIVQAISEICMDIVREKVVGDEKENTEKKTSVAHTYSDITKKIIRIVEKEMSNTELSLKWIAENYLFMNVDYLSRRFIDDTGQKFSSYLSSTRMNRAKEIIMTSDKETIYTIADKVGYGNNPQYFSQIFKKSTGMSPTEFMKRIR